MNKFKIYSEIETEDFLYCLLGLNMLSGESLWLGKFFLFFVFFFFFQCSLFRRKFDIRTKFKKRLVVVSLAQWRKKHNSDEIKLQLEHFFTHGFSSGVQSPD